MAEPVMVKKVTVLIKSVEDNQYGDILVSGIDLNGKEWEGKIGKKRADGLRPQIAVDRWTEFGYANYMDKDYIAQAQFSQPPAGHPAKEKVNNSPELSPVTPQAKSSPVSDKDRQIARAVAFKGAVEMACSGMIDKENIIPVATVYEGYLIG